MKNQLYRHFYRKCPYSFLVSYISLNSNCFEMKFGVWVKYTYTSSTKPKKLINHHYYGLQGVTVRTLAIFEISICRRIISHRNINTLQTFMKFATDVLQTLLYLKEKLIPSWYQNIWLYRWVLAKFVNFSKKHNEVCFWENIDLEQIDLIQGFDIPV